MWGLYSTSLLHLYSTSLQILENRMRTFQTGQRENIDLFASTRKLCNRARTKIEIFISGCLKRRETSRKVV